MAQPVAAWVEQKRSAIAKLVWERTEKPEVKESLASIDPAAIRILFAAFARASCLEEARIILRYQEGRDRQKWPRPVVAAIEDAMKAAEKDAAEAAVNDHVDAARVAWLAAWMGFLVQLHRFHHTAAREAREGAPRGGGGPGRREGGQYVR